MKPTVSIIVPTYNRYFLLRKTLESICLQTFSKKKIEIIISDDGSTDNTYDLVHEFKNLLNIKYLYQNNIGRRVSLARNEAIKISQGTFCLFIDSGIVLSKNCVKKHLSSLEAAEKDSCVASLGSVFGLTEFGTYDNLLNQLLENLTIDECINYCRYRQVFMDNREIIQIKNKISIGETYAPWIYFWTGNVMIPKKILAQVGLFDTNYDLQWGMEDIDIGYRIHKLGKRIVFNKLASCIHMPHENDTISKKEDNIKNLLYFCSKFEEDAEIKNFKLKRWNINEFY